MDASQCSVLVVADAQNSDDSLSLLHTTFSSVTFVPTHTDIVGILQAHNRNKDDGSATLVILDDSVFSKVDLFDTLDSLRFALSIGLLQHVAPVVYSSSQSTDYMLECLDHGAVNYILKPLRQDVVTTLFLNTLRESIRQRRKDHHQQSTLGTHAKASPAEANSDSSQGKVWKAFEQRLQSLGDVNHNLIYQSISNFFKSENTISRSDMKKIASDSDLRLKTRLCTWGFAPFDLKNYELLQCAFLVLKHVLALPELNDYSVSDGDLYDFLFDVANMYQPLNPYHNFRHAVDVMQSTFYFLCRIGVLSLMDPQASPAPATTDKHPGCYDWLENDATMKDLITPLDALALVLASIGHDVGHPGVNNMFMIRTATPLALMYNDRSVLESFHAMVFFNILQRHCFRRLTEWQTTAKYTRFRKIVVQSILATDMGMHDDYVNKIQRQRERLDTSPVDVSNNDRAEEEIILICGSLIKCADIGNCARPFPVAKEWAEILQREFFAQGDLERELGLSVLPINDRGKIPLEDFQLGFKKNIAEKLFVAVANVLPDMEFTVDTIESNCTVWESRKQNRCGLKSADEAAACDNHAPKTGASDDHSGQASDQHQVSKNPGETQMHDDPPHATPNQQQPSPTGLCGQKDDSPALNQDQDLSNKPGGRKKKNKLSRHCILQ
ncbi:hypothetical protein [Absidia glauca]|uniref:Phosphodiesterase n=1 Tax=Absidia glauca TaxID=4829 RepID=A0A168P1B0_ABSGL|nr:hypothetical protein [Absidia glauca]